MPNNLELMIWENLELFKTVYLSFHWFNHSCGFELVTRGFELVTRGYEFVIRGFEFVTRGFKLVTRGFELVTRGFDSNSHFWISTRAFKLSTRNSCFTISRANKGIYRGLSVKVNENSPWLKLVLCLNHRLELSIKDTFSGTFLTKLMKCLENFIIFTKIVLKDYVSSWNSEQYWKTV